MTAPSPSPVDGFVSELRELAGDDATVESIAGGPQWLSLRVRGRYIWIVTVQPLRRAWISDEPIPRDALRVLGWHEKSPFAEHLRGASLVGSSVLQTEDGRTDGLRIELTRQGQPMSLTARFWPRPGALWLDMENGERLAQIGRMEGASLLAREPQGVAPAHDGRAELLAWAFDLARQRLLQQSRNAVKRKRRLLEHLKADLAQATDTQDRRTDADILAARLSDVPSGVAEITLEDFEGNPRSIQLNPALNPAANLSALYKRVAKAERKVEDLTNRTIQVENQFEALEGNPARVEEASTLEEMLTLADQWELSIQPRDKGQAAAQRRGESDRRPYKQFETQGFEIRVGRSAKDNDELLRRFTKPRDLWLHASGVEGSHVIIVSQGRDVPAPVIEHAAGLAAWFSKAKHSATVGVVVTERRYVRKPRKAKTGSVVAERARTLFVSPMEPLRS